MQQYQLAVDITDTLQIKMAALACYPSQIGPTQYHQAFEGLARYRGVMSLQGKYAEVFEVIKTNTLGGL